MKVHQPDSITKFIKSNELTFEIPVYQRNYVWKIEDCEKLFEDILEGIRNNRKHYFGNIVYYQAGQDPFSGYTRYILIDGQQRITSTMLLLAAIRDEETDDSNKTKLTSTYLMNDNADENFRVKLKQVETDRSVYESIIEGRMDEINKYSIIFRNYNKFRKLVKKVKQEDNLDSTDLMNGIGYLEIIAIDLESDKENAESPQVIFESINATGEPLSTADLLRNFLLLEVGIDRQAEVYKNYWLVIEKNIGNENISDFVRRYITLKSTIDIKKDTEYKEFKKNYKSFFSNAEEAIKELSKFSKYYKWIKRPDSIAKEHPKTSLILQDLDDLRMLPATPAIMWLLEQADNDRIDFEDINNTLDIIASWSFRARITNIINTGEIGSILTTKILELLKNKQGDSSFANYIWFELSNYQIRDIYPSDEIFKNAFVHYDFYKNYRKYVQIKLASGISNDQTEVSLESIEHIMPQKIEQDKWPGISISEHAEWINTIGNLTPMNMVDNPAASNESYEFKLQYIESSDWKITRDIARKWKSWNIETIQDRANELSKLAVGIWRSPQKRTREIVAILPENSAKIQKFKDWIDDFNINNLKIDLENSKRSYLRFTTDFMDSIIPQREDSKGSWKNGRAYYYELYTESNGYTSIQLAFSLTALSDGQKQGQNQVLEALNITKPQDKKQYLVPQTWKLNYKEGDLVLKEEVQRILEDEIPELEKEIKIYIANHK